MLSKPIDKHNCFYRRSGKWITGGKKLGDSEHFPTEFCSAVAECVMSALAVGLRGLHAQSNKQANSSGGVNVIDLVLVVTFSSMQS